MYVSIGIIAWNEEDTIGGVLESLLGQTVFKEVTDRGLGFEILVVANGCTDRTCEVASVTLAEALGEPPPDELPAAGKFQFRPQWSVIALPERGKLNAWNQFVHRLSAPEARFFVFLDADIRLGEPETIWNMIDVLRQNHEANVSVDLPRKRFGEAGSASLHRLSNSAGVITAAAPAQLCAQLYCIRAEIARNIYLPRDLSACDDGFIKALVCTDSLTRPLNPGRICTAPNASHYFEPYTSPAAVLRNQKRQVMGQTMVHLLIDKYLPSLPYKEKLQLGETLKERDATDPAWLKRMVAEHVARTTLPWRLYPGLLTHRFRHLKRMSLGRRIATTPALLAGMGISLAASWMAFRALKRGCVDYWPKASRSDLHQTTSQIGNRKLHIN